MSYNTLFAQYLSRKQSEYGDKFDHSDLTGCPDFVTQYNHGRNRRVKVKFADGRVKWGTIGVTTGWKPCFILLHNRYCHGSSETINPGDRIIDCKDL